MTERIYVELPVSDGSFEHCKLHDASCKMQDRSDGLATTFDSNYRNSMNILVIDDDASLRRTLRTSLEVLGHQAAEARDGAKPWNFLEAGRSKWRSWICVWLRNKGLDLLPRLLTLAPGLHVVVVTAYATIETAVEAMRRGAFDYLPKPFTPDQLRLVLDRIARMRRLQSQVDELEAQVRSVVPEVDLETQRAEDARDARYGLQDGGQRGDYSAARRERHGQGRVGQGDPCPQPAGRGAVRYGPLSQPLG